MIAIFMLVYTPIMMGNSPKNIFPIPSGYVKIAIENDHL